AAAAHVVAAAAVARSGARAVARSRRRRRSARSAGAGAGGRRHAAAADPAGGVAHVFLRFIGALGHGVLGLAVHVAAAVGPVAGVFGDLADAFRRLIGDVPRLFRQLVAQLGAGLRREQHPEPRAEHGAGQEPHDEAAAAVAFVLETIVTV